MKTFFIIRTARQADVVELKELFQNTVLAINRRDYSQEEVEDWASCGENLSNIAEMIKTHYFIVAVNRLSEIVGFSSITPQGYLHSMFVHKDFQGEGIATMLLEEIERYAVTIGIRRITSEVSLTARPFFLKRGYFVMEEQKRQANQLCLTNFWMAKELSCNKEGAVIQIETDKKQYLDLLLLADEQESMIDRYLERGEMFVLEDNGVKAVCVVTDEGNGVCELKNIAVTPEFQRQGYGRKLVNHLFTRYSGKYSRMLVGTGEVPSTLGFYKSCGFEYSHRIENFFTDNYDHPMIEDGVLLKDMVYLKRAL